MLIYVLKNMYFISAKSLNPDMVYLLWKQRRFGQNISKTNMSGESMKTMTKRQGIQRWNHISPEEKPGTGSTPRRKNQRRCKSGKAGCYHLHQYYIQFPACIRFHSWRRYWCCSDCKSSRPGGFRRSAESATGLSGSWGLTPPWNIHVGREQTLNMSHVSPIRVTRTRIHSRLDRRGSASSVAFCLSSLRSADEDDDKFNKFRVRLLFETNF